MDGSWSFCCKASFRAVLCWTRSYFPKHLLAQFLYSRWLLVCIRTPAEACFFLVDIPQYSQSQPQAKPILTAFAQKTFLCYHFCISKHLKIFLINILLLFKLTGFVAGATESSLWKSFSMLSDILRRSLQNHLKFLSAGLLHHLAALWIVKVASSSGSHPAPSVSIVFRQIIFSPLLITSCRCPVPPPN